MSEPVFTAASARWAVRTSASNPSASGCAAVSMASRVYDRSAILYGMSSSEFPPGWTEDDSAHFINDGHYFVPERETQISIMCALIPALDGVLDVVDLCCGEGLLTEAILTQHVDVRVLAYDGSPAMLAATERRGAHFGARLTTRRFELAGTDWRHFSRSLCAVVSSLAVHHLDAAGKQTLFRDMAAVLAPGGALIIADLIAPTTPEGLEIAAQSWDDSVKRRIQTRSDPEAVFQRFVAGRWNLYRDPEPDPIDQPSSLFEQLSWMRDAGLSAVDVHWMKAGHAIFSGRKPG